MTSRQHVPSEFPRTVPYALSGAAFAIALLFAWALGLFARGSNVFGWDLSLTRSVQKLDGGLWNAITNIGNLIGSTAFGAVAISVCLIAGLLLQRRSDAMFLADLLLLRLAATQLKPFFDSARPPANLVEIVGTWDGTGYPSGHSMTAMTMMLGLAVLGWRHLPRQWAILLGVFAAEIVFVVGFARVWSGAHWTSDVLGGFGFGVAMVSLSVLLTERLYRRERVKRALATGRR